MTAPAAPSQPRRRSSGTTTPSGTLQGRGEPRAQPPIHRRVTTDRHHPEGRGGLHAQPRRAVAGESGPATTRRREKPAAGSRGGPHE
ncbi:Exonuclease SbcC [Actinacidiphila cocklensis]|uniref:Exonuclease SbcC n=1 Tax=Actinacidiphila cocklensis TaxID=887465 RepID=A0A9W4GPT7_9ACTN|nr:Exonuclease SbcC [Actinacidiphila cocklensis]